MNKKSRLKIYYQVYYLKNKLLLYDNPKTNLINKYNKKALQYNVISGRTTFEYYGDIRSKNNMKMDKKVPRIKERKDSHYYDDMRKLRIKIGLCFNKQKQGELINQYIRLVQEFNEKFGRKLSDNYLKSRTTEEHQKWAEKENFRQKKAWRKYNYKRNNKGIFFIALMKIKHFIYGIKNWIK